MKKTLIEKIMLLGYNKDKAERIIRAGQVKVNEEVIFTPSQKLNEGDKVLLKESKEWVSRGALKLLSAISKFKLDLKDKVILDIGSSTGGFTQVSLVHGAKHVFALDVGTNQLDYKLRSNEKVTSIEKTNLKTITKNMFDKKIDIVVTDVSFISLKYVFKVIKELETPIIMALIKPQFEANSDQVQTGGIVSIELHDEIINKVIGFATDNGFILKEIDKSPITGKQSKNIEYITIFERG